MPAAPLARWLSAAASSWAARALGSASESDLRCGLVARATQVAEEAALEAARLWDPGVSQVAHVRSGENETWAADLRGTNSIVRITSEHHRTRDQLEAELDFVEYLAGNGLAVACPLVNQEGQRVAEVPRRAARGERGWAVAFRRLEGRHYEYYSADIDRPLFRLWGETMGRLHSLSTRYEPPAGRWRPHWYDDAVAGCARDGVPLDEEALGLREELVRWLKGVPSEDSHYGTVHGDFERTNFLIHVGRIGVFDFDDSCRHWFMWDVACALWVFRNATANERASFLGWFLEGYSTEKEPDPERLASFTELVRLRTVALLLHRLRNPQRFSSVDDRDWADQARSWLRSTWSW